jgi:hypothetical protein
MGLVEALSQACRILQGLNAHRIPSQDVFYPSNADPQDLVHQTRGFRMETFKFLLCIHVLRVFTEHQDIIHINSYNDPTIIYKTPGSTYLCLKPVDVTNALTF